MKKVLFTAISLFLIGSLAFAQVNTGKATRQIRARRYGGFQCGGDPILPTDGSITADFVSAASSSYYFVHLKAGHSYSAEVWDPLDETIVVGTAQLALLTTGTCSALTTMDVASMDPDLSNNFSDRISWIQASDGDAILQVNNTDQVNFYNYSVRITDTTLRNARWSTALGGAFSTHYGFLNATASAITGTLTLHQSDGTVYTAPVNIPAGGEVFETVCGTGSPGCSAQNIEVPSNKAGFATFVFIGPPGAVVADGYFQAAQTGGIVIVPTAWSPKNSQH
jgi:hypothetical protein